MESGWPAWPGKRVRTVYGDNSESSQEIDGLGPCPVGANHQGLLDVGSLGRSGDEDAPAAAEAADLFDRLAHGADDVALGHHRD